MAAGKADNIALTKFSQGSIRELLALAIPLFVISFSACLLGFIERVWFSSHSLDTLEAAYNAVNVLRIFQLPCIALVTMAQAYVGYYNGSQEKNIHWLLHLADDLVLHLFDGHHHSIKLLYESPIFRGNRD
jgi:Na+-driven multidrug efflux pump